MRDAVIGGDEAEALLRRAAWRLTRQPSFLNSLWELHLHNRAARVTLYRSANQGEEPARLYELDTTELAPG
jgi:hypothetical protein